MLFYTHNPSKFAFSREKSDIDGLFSDDSIFNKHIPLTDVTDESLNAEDSDINNSESTNSITTNFEINNSEIADSDILSKISKSDKVFGLIGVPFDGTTTYRPGARFGPAAIREASYNFENYNMAFDCSLDVIFFDFGDVEVSHGNFKRTCHKLQDTVTELLNRGITPLIMGGDHSISYGVLKAIESRRTLDEVTVIHFDAHMDIIDNYAEEKFSHATIMRRIFDLHPKKIIQLGVRSASFEEMDFVKEQKKKQKIDYFTAQDIREDIGLIEHILSQIDGPVYLTVDIDVLDPSFAPEVGTPSPCGISPCHMEKLIKILAKKDVVGMDLVEVASDKIGDITSSNAAKIIYDFLCLQK